MSHELNTPKHRQYASRRQNRRACRTDESRKWIRPYVDVLGILKNETKINYSNHPNDLTKVAWTKRGVIATKHLALQASVLTAMTHNGLCTQTIERDSAERAFVADIRRIAGTGKVEITTDGATWTDITRRINNKSFTQVSTKVRTSAHPTIGFRLGTYRDEIAVSHVQSVEL